MNTKQTAADDIITTKELSKRVHASPRTLYDWRNKLNMPFIQLSERCIRYSWMLVAEWMVKSFGSK